VTIATPIEAVDQFNAAFGPPAMSATAMSDCDECAAALGA
jgi:hypothetical protein